MPANRPLGRKKTVSGGGSGVNVHGSGQGTGPVGSSGGMKKPSSRPAGGGGARAARGAGLSLPVIIIMVIAYLFLGGGGGSQEVSYPSGSGYSSSGSAGGSGGLTTGSSQTGSGTTGSGSLSDFYEYFNQQTGQSSGNSQGSTSANSQVNADSSSVNAEVADGVPHKRTQIVGGGEDVITIMVYMCGTDLESRSAMATSDLSEMTKANISDNINLLVYTGGCSRWQNNVVSSSVNQIYRIRSGKLERLVADDGAKVMTNPSTLSSFIKWSAENFPANRYDLIFWDHGGGSVSGYGYDEKNKRSGSMSLSGINKALKDGGVTFDFVGFDACLMATAETALMVDDYADYMIASEETEPGIGWYYTNWLTKLSGNTSMPTTQIGRNIVDDFTAACAQSCRGQKTTLSLIDLAEFSYTVPKKLTAFSQSVRALLKDKEYQTVSDARYSTREFASSSRIDQVDLVDLALKVGTEEGQDLADTLRAAVKYNKTSSNMTNAYGVSIYFPYQRTSYVDSMCSTYSDIGMDEEYSKCIREFASLETSGQIMAGGSASSSPMGSLFGSLLGGGASSGGSSSGSIDYDTLGSLLGGSSSSSGSGDLVGALLGSFLSDPSMISGLTSGNTGFFSDRAMSEEDTAEYLTDHYFDPENLVWTENADGTATMDLSEDQWSLVHDLDLNMFYDTGSGYVDLGLDNIFSFDDDGTLIADTERNWISLNGQPVAYYRESTMGDESNYLITGYVPALLNGTPVHVILAFDTENPQGYVAGYRTTYSEEDTLTLAKNDSQLVEGDTLQFLCDFYSYDGEYQDSYLLGDPLTVNGEITITNTDVGEGGVKLMYRFTDIYNQQYWTPALDR